jgi:hypothetical protein
MLREDLRRIVMEVVMPFPISVCQENGHFVATLLGAPEVRTEGMTREAALAEMQTILEHRVTTGELVSLEVSHQFGILAIAGKYKDDESLTEICEEIYRQRDAEPKE